MNLPPSLLKRLNDAIRDVYTGPDQLARLLMSLDLRLVDVAATQGTYVQILDGALEDACRYRWIERFVAGAIEGRPLDDALRAVGDEVLAEAARWRARAPDSFSAAERDELLAFMVKCFDATADVDATLARLSYSHKGRWQPCTSPRDNYRGLVEFATDSGWDRLLAFVLFCDRWTRPEVPQLAERLLHRHEFEAIRLFDALNQIKLGEGAVAKFYRESVHDHSVQPMLPPGAKVTTEYVAYAIAAAQDAVRSSPVPGADAPARTFLELVGGVGADAESKVAAFWEQVSDSWNLPQLTVNRGEQERQSVIVELQDHSTWTREKPCWTRRAWLYHHRSKKRDRLDDHLADAPETIATMPAYLNALRNQLATWRIGPGGVLFEVFLSLRSLTHAIDQWSVLLDDSIPIEIGFENPVVLRSIDRSHKLRNKLEARWKQLHTARGLTGSVVCKSRGGNLVELYKEFEKQSGLLCLVLECPLGTDRDPEAEFPCVRAAITAGLPVIIWAREETAARSLGLEATGWWGSPPCRLPETVYHVRRNHKVLGPHLTLFFENAGHWLPDDTRAVEART